LVLILVRSFDEHNARYVGRIQACKNPNVEAAE
jgi:hypothetical protein